MYDEIKIKAEIRKIAKAIKRVKQNPMTPELDKDAIRDLKAQRREMVEKLTELQSNRVKRVEELATRYDFALTEAGDDLWHLKAQWEHSDGMVISTDYMSLDCCYQFLLGYCAAKYESY